MLDGSKVNERYENEYNHIVDSIMTKYQAGEDDSFEDTKLDKISREIDEDIWVYETDPDKNIVEDEDDAFMEKIFEETGRQLDLKAVADHVMGKERNVKAVEDFLWFLGKRDEKELDWN